MRRRPLPVCLVRCAASALAFSSIIRDAVPEREAFSCIEKSTLDTRRTLSFWTAMQCGRSRVDTRRHPERVRQKTATGRLLLFAAFLLFGGTSAAQGLVPDTCSRADYANAGAYYQEARVLILNPDPDPVREVLQLRFDSINRAISQAEKDDTYRLVEVAHGRALSLFDEILELRKGIDRQAGWTDYRLWRTLSAISGALSDYAWATLGPIYTREEDLLANSEIDFAVYNQSINEAEMWLHMAALSCRLDQLESQ